MGKVTTESLKCFKNDVTDWIIAETKEEATKILIAIYGEEFMEDIREVGDELYWNEVPLNSTLSIHDDSEDPSVGSTKKTVRDWIAEKGRGHLCSTEY